MFKEVKRPSPISQDKILVEIEALNKEFLNDKGFYFIKSDKTLSREELESYDYLGDPFFIYSNGETNLTVVDSTDVREQYFYYHIYFKGEGIDEIKGISRFEKNIIEKISKIIEEFINKN